MFNGFFTPQQTTYYVLFESSYIYVCNMNFQKHKFIKLLAYCILVIMTYVVQFCSCENVRY